MGVYQTLFTIQFNDDLQALIMESTPNRASDEKICVNTKGFRIDLLWRNRFVDKNQCYLYFMKSTNLIKQHWPDVKQQENQ